MDRFGDPAGAPIGWVACLAVAQPERAGAGVRAEIGDREMLYMIINRTRKDLNPEQMAALGRLAQGFYESVPEGITLLGDWAAADGSRTFALMECEDASLLERVQAPFRAYVDMEVVPVVRVAGWGKR